MWTRPATRSGSAARRGGSGGWPAPGPGRVPRGGGTFTITNPGVFGSLFGTPVINQPQVAILGIGTIEKRSVVIEDEDGNDTLAIKTMS